VLTFADLRGDRKAGANLPLFDAPPVVRTFDTPEFAGITFYEVEAKSILNRVPAASRMPFEWTINVYRGCSHSCSYCLTGGTPILMADGRTKPLADVRAGDEVYGTIFDGKYRRYAITEVLDHWATTKPAYQVSLEDGTKLVASGDHCFLTQARGWKHVTGSEQGLDRRPHLTVNNELIGTGRFATAPKDGPEFRRGYLCGMIRGDGNLGHYSYQRPGRTNGDVYRFRLALTDTEGLERTHSYLADFGITTTEFVFQEATSKRQKLHAIRTQSKGNVLAIQEHIRWPATPSTEWRKGFLAGVFDAEGSYSRGILRIANTDPEIIEQIKSSLTWFGFTFTVETVAKAKPMTYVRILGGVRECLRFFLTVDPAITRKRSIEGQAIKNKTPLRAVSIKALGLELPMFDITTGTGDFIADGVVSHNCFARPTHNYINFDAGRDFESKIVVKVNAPEVLRRELRRASWAGAHVAMGTNTDPYQRCEGRYELTRGVLEVLRDFANPCSILTKSPLLVRDLDLFEELVEVGFSASLSVGTLDEEVWRRSEPGTPHPKARIAAVKALVEAGVPCGVLVAPVLPGISDSPAQLRAVVDAAAAAGATHISPITLHLRPGVREEFMPWLERAYPELVAGYRRLYRGSNAPEPVQRRIAERVRAVKATARTRDAVSPVAEANHRGIVAAPPPAPEPEPEPEPEAPAQLSLGFG
jgi:DNA repair photolyase